MSEPVVVQRDGLYTRRHLADLGLTQENVAWLEEFFGLVPLLGGGTTPYLYLGQHVLDALDRRCRRECVEHRRPLSRAELRAMRKAVTQ